MGERSGAPSLIREDVPGSDDPYFSKVILNSN